MCEPTTIALGLTLVAGAYQAKQQNDAGKFEARVAEQNAGIADQQARDALNIGMIEEERTRQGIKRALGTQRATLAANGVDLSSGSALALVSDTAGLGEQDAYLTRASAIRSAWGFGVQASNSRGQAAQSRAAGRNAAVGTLLTTGAQAYGTYSGKSGTVRRNPGSSSSTPVRFTASSASNGRGGYNLGPR